MVKRLPLNYRLSDRLLRVQDVHARETLLSQQPERITQLTDLPPEHFWRQPAVESVAFDADLVWQIEHDGNDWQLVVACQLNKRLPRARPHVGRVDQGQPPALQPPGGDEPQGLKASLLASGAASSSATNARNASEVRISVGRKCLRAKVVLPTPDGPTNRMSDGFGMSMVIVRISCIQGSPSVGNLASVAPRANGSPLLVREEAPPWC